MLLLVAIVFVGVFSLVALLILASGKKTTPESQVIVKASRAYKSADPIEDFRKSVLLSAIPWMHRWLMKIELAPRLKLMLYQADLKWTVGTTLLISVTTYAVAAYLVYFRTRTLFLALLISVPIGFAPLGVIAFRRARRFAQFEKVLPDALDLMVSALRAGHSFNAALGLVSRETPEPVRSEFRICFDEQNYGLELSDAMENLITRVPLSDLRISTTAILIQKESGGNLAEVLNNTAGVIRERLRLKKQVSVHTAHGRMTGWVIGLLPLGLLLALYIVNPDLESLLWKRDLGVKLLYAGAGTMVIGGLLIRRIVRMDV